jgi:hypothetical protein
LKLVHRHHIIPRHMGGTDDPSNIIEVTVEEHAELHRRLYNAFGHWEDKIAYLGLSGRIGKEEIIREKARAKMLGTKLPQEVCEKKSASLKKCWEEGRFKRNMPDKWPAKRRKVFGDGREWESMSEAARQLGVANASTIQYRCKNGIGDWRYL